MGEYQSIDEVSLSQGKLYTIVTNKLGRRKGGYLIDCINGASQKDIIEVFEKLPLDLRKKVK